MMHLLMALVFVSSSVFAQDIEIETTFLTPSEIVKVIGPFPVVGSAAHNEDFKVLYHLQKTRTAEDCALAAKDVELNVSTLFGGDKGILNNDEASRMSIFLLKAYANSGLNIHLAKNVFKRPRPYVLKSDIKPCIELEKSYAYPSGHSLVARLYARILSRVFPERAEKFMKRSTEYSMNRVIGGVHHPSDVKAGHALADYLATKMIENDRFMQELNEL